MNRDFLKEAIADAKAVKESAIANAKAALEEAFTPKLKSMLAAKLEEMEDFDESADEVDEAKNVRIKEKMSNPVMRHGYKGDSPTEKYSDEMRDKDMNDEDMDLDEILAELEKGLKEDARTDAEEEGYKDGMKDEKEDLDEDERTDAEEEGYEDGEEDEKEDIEDDEEEDIDLEDMSEDDLKTFIEDVIGDMVEGGELEAGEGFDAEDEEDVDIDIDVDSEEEVELTEYDKEWVQFCKDNPDWYQCESKIRKFKSLMQESKKGNEDEQKRAEGAIRDDRDHISDLKGDIDDQEKKLAKLKKDAKKDLDEAYTVIKALRGELTEINLLNAKLLYSNKIFKARSLTEAQKTKVLGAFDNATTVKEVKLVFATLKEGIKPKRKPVTEGIIGSASKSTRSPKTSRKPIVESNEMIKRFQKLAGIIKS